MSRIRADKVINRAGTGAPELTYGASIPVGYAITGAGGVNVTGVITATSFVGALTGTSSGNLVSGGALGTPSSGTLTNCTFPTLNQNTTGTASTATTANALNTSNSYQVSALGIGQSAGTGTELDLAGRYAQTSIAVAALDIDCSLGNYFTKTINESVTFTVSNIPASRTYTFAIHIYHSSGTITWFSGVRWPKNTAPTLTTSRQHTFIFTTHDGGTNWFGAALVDYTT